MARDGLLKKTRTRRHSSQGTALFAGKLTNGRAADGSEAMDGTDRAGVPLSRFGVAPWPLPNTDGLLLEFGRTDLGPPLEGLFGREEALRDGRHIVADENYLSQSILYPDQEVVAGYEPRMPGFAAEMSAQSNVIERSTNRKQVRELIFVWMALLSLLAATAAVGLLPWKNAHGAINLTISIAKTLLIGVFFMHLKSSGPLAR